MRTLFFALLCGLSCSISAQTYDRSAIATLLEDQSYSAILDIAAQTASPEPYLLKAAGYAAYQSGLPDRAADYYRQVLQADSLNIAANLYSGLIRRQQKRYAEAKPFFERLVAAKPDQAKYLKYLADCYSGLKMEDTALRYLDKAFMIAGRDLSIAQSYAEALYALKRYAVVDNVVAAGLAVDSAQVGLLSLGVRSAYQQKQYTKSLALARKLMVAGTGATVYTPVMFGALSALQLKDYHACLDCTQYLIAEGNETEQVLYYAAKAYAGLKDFAVANAYLEKCLELAISEHTAAYYIELGENMEQLKLYAKAQRHYDTARYFAAGNMVLYRKALAYEAANQKEKAKKAYLDFIRVSGEKDTAALNFAKKRVEQL